MEGKGAGEGGGEKIPLMPYSPWVLFLRVIFPMDDSTQGLVLTGSCTSRGSFSPRTPSRSLIHTQRYSLE